MKNFNDCTVCYGTGRLLDGDTGELIATCEITPLETSEECSECHGAGFIPKLYPSGHTEETCDRCEGSGYLE